MQNFLYMHNKVLKIIFDGCTSSIQQSNANKLYHQQVTQSYVYWTVHHCDS